MSCIYHSSFQTKYKSNISSRQYFQHISRASCSQSHSFLHMHTFVYYSQFLSSSFLLVQALSWWRSFMRQLAKSDNPILLYLLRICSSRKIHVWILMSLFNSIILLLSFTLPKDEILLTYNPDWLYQPSIHFGMVTQVGMVVREGHNRSHTLFISKIEKKYYKKVKNLTSFLRLVGKEGWHPL